MPETRHACAVDGVAAACGRQWPRRSEAGFSLMELMVTMAVTLVVLNGAFLAFDDARRASDTTALIADGNQNLRAAVAQIIRDVLQTGREIPSGGIPIPFSNGASAIRRPGPEGVELFFLPTWEVLPAVCPGSGLGPDSEGLPTDLITVLYGDATLPLNEWPLSSVQSDGARVTVDARTSIADPRSGVVPGDLIWFTNALGNALQTVTAVEGQTLTFEDGSTVDSFGLNQRTADQGTILQIRNGTTFPPTTATRVVMVTFYLDTTTVPGVPRLIRRVNFGEPRAMAIGINGLQATYDLVDGATNPTNLDDVVVPNSPMQVRKLNLFVSSITQSRFAETREPARTAVSTQVSLRSMSFVDRYQ